jgi:integrase family protein with SAM-like domain
MIALAPNRGKGVGFSHRLLLIKYIIMGRSLAKNEGQEDHNKTLIVKDGARALTAAEFHRLAEVPPAIEWFGNIRNEKTRRAYKSDVQDFMRFVGIQSPEEFRIVTRAHVIAWRDTLLARKRADASIRRALSALSSLFMYLCMQKKCVCFEWKICTGEKASCTFEYVGRDAKARRSGSWPWVREHSG